MMNSFFTSQCYMFQLLGAWFLEEVCFGARHLGTRPLDRVRQRHLRQRRLTQGHCHHHRQSRRSGEDLKMLRSKLTIRIAINFINNSHLYFSDQCNLNLTFSFHFWKLNATKWYYKCLECSLWRFDFFVPDRYSCRCHSGKQNCIWKFENPRPLELITISVITWKKRIKIISDRNKTHEQGKQTEEMWF